MTTPPASDRATARKAWGVFFSVAGAAFVVDLGTKAWVFSRLEKGQTLRLIPGLLDLVVSKNPGAAFSLGSGRTGLLIAVTAAACAAILWSAWRYGKTSVLLNMALALIFGGAMGNLWDRLFEGGHVRDFLFLHLGDHVAYPAIFNVADVVLVIGCGLFVIHSFRKEKDKDAEHRRKRAPAR